MAIIHKKIIPCLLDIGAVSIHMASFGVTTKHTTHPKKKKTVPVQTATVPAAKPITMPVIAMPKPTPVSSIDPKQVYTPSKIFPPVNVDGNIRIYDFDRHLSRHGTTDQTAFSLGGKINALTDVFLGHFRLGGTVYTAQPLGLNSKNLARQDASLPATALTTIGQAFVQYESPYFLGRLGDMLITTPWLNPADSRMIPAAYQALYGVFAPIQSFNTPDKSLNFVAFRQIRFKSRTADSFTQHNLYNTNSYTVATTTIAALGDTTDIGTLAGGALYKQKTFSAQAWAYRFYNFSKIYYADFKYTFANKTLFRPIIGAQALNNPADGNNVISTLPGQGSVNSSAYGLLIGTEIGNGQILFGWNNIPKRNGGYRNGDIVSPYTSGYSADPLYTTSMTAGLVEKAAGSAQKLSAMYAFLDHQLVLYASGARYFTRPFATNSSEVDLDAIYTPEQFFKRSLSLRARLGFANQTTNGKLTYGRLMMEYDFA